MAEASLSDAEVRLKILGEHNTIDVAALHKALGALLDLLQSGGVRTGLVITDLREGSAELAVRPRAASPEVEARFREIVAGLGDLSGERVADAWDAAMLESAMSLAGTLDFVGVQGLEISTGGRAAVNVTGTTLTTAQRALATTSVSIGSVTGRIHRFFDHKSRREFGLVDELTQHAVKVTFTLDKEEKVLRAVGQTVEAWGELRRNRDGRKVQLKLEDLRVVDHSTSLGPDDIAGILGGDWTGGEGSVEAVRRQRDGE